jgi:hypothetical protein
MQQAGAAGPQAKTVTAWHDASNDCKRAFLQARADLWHQFHVLND